MRRQRGFRGHHCIYITLGGGTLYNHESRLGLCYYEIQKKKKEGGIFCRLDIHTCLAMVYPLSRSIIELLRIHPDLSVQRYID